MATFDSICFIYPDRGDGSKYDRMFPPLGLEIVAAGVRDCVRRRHMIDLRFERDWERSVPADTDLAALSMLWDMPLDEVWSLVRRLRRLRPGICVVMGGRFAEANRKALVTGPEDARVDAVFSGPDDGRFADFVRSGSAHGIPGVAFLRGDGYHESPLPPYGPIPDRPLPDRSLRRVRYRMIRRDGFELGIETDAIQTSRGCPFHCAFCTFNRDSQGRQIKYTSRSPESIADELEEIEAPYVVLVDDLAFHRPDRMDELCDVLLSRGIRKTFGIETRINMGMRPEVVEKMARTGFRHVTFGLESMHDHVLEFLNKGLKRSTIERCFAKIRHVQMVFIANFIIGNVGETREQMLQIPHFARSIGLDFIMIHPLRCRGPEPLTRKVLAAPGYHIDPSTRRVYSDDISYEEIRQISRRIKREFWTPAQKLRTAYKIWRLIEPARISTAALNWAAWKLRGSPDVYGERPGGSPPGTLPGSAVTSE